MKEPISLYGTSYYADLISFRERCLSEHATRKRMHIGAVSLGRGLARWGAASGAIASLHDEGLRIGARNSRRWPTVLHLESVYPNNEGYAVTSFYMWLEGSGEVEVRTSDRKISSLDLSLAGRVYEHLVERGRTSVLGYQTTMADDHERRLLYQEMQRGSSGDYSM